MHRYLVIVFIVLLGCVQQQDQPVVSGYMWGGEGNRMVISVPNDNSFTPDTLIISSSGQIYWNPDTLEPGFYALSKLTGESLLLQLSKEQPVFVDAQYIIYPEHVQLKGSEYSNQLLALERNSREWLLAMQSLTVVIDSPGWIPNRPAVEKLNTQLDSLKENHRKRALEISNVPMVRMYALIQGAGNHFLFDPWKDRQLFFRADSLLASHRNLREVDHFAKMVNQLREQEKDHTQFNPDKHFPDISFVYNDEYFSLGAFTGQNIYLEFPDLTDPISRSHLNRLLSIQTYGIEVCLVYDANEALPTEKISDFHYLVLLDYSKIATSIGNIPVNFIIDSDGVIIARNVWDVQLEEIAEFIQVEE